MDELNRVWEIDWSRVKPEVLDGLRKGTMRLVDGVAYWKKGVDEGTGIVQHLPFKPTDPQQVEAVLKGLPVMGAGAVAVPVMVAAAAVIGAVVISTAYLANKLNKLQDTADQILQSNHNQNFVYYLEKVTRYVGLMETAREYLLDRSAAPSLKGMMQPLVVEMATSRNEAISFVDNLLNFARSSELHLKDKELILQFVAMMLELIPAGVHLEHLLHARIGNIDYSETILTLGRKAYERGLLSHRQWCSAELKRLIKGGARGETSLIEKAEENCRALIQSEQAKALLQYLDSGAELPIPELV